MVTDSQSVDIGIPLSHFACPCRPTRYGSRMNRRGVRVAHAIAQRLMAGAHNVLRDRFGYEIKKIPTEEPRQATPEHVTFLFMDETLDVRHDYAAVRVNDYETGAHRTYRPI
jgi:hypothetical protein